MKFDAPNALLSMSRTSSSGSETAFSMRRKRARRWSAVRCEGFASTAMLGASGVAASRPSKS